MGDRKRGRWVEIATSVAISSLGFMIAAMYLTFKYYERTGWVIGRAWAEPVEYALVFSTIPLYLGLGYIFYQEKTTLRELRGYRVHLEGLVEERTEEINEINRRLQESNHLKDVFIDIMHHDLLNPLGAANTIASLALRTETDPVKRDDLTNIKLSVDQGINIIENATELSKLDDITELSLEDLDLAEMIERTVNSFKRVASEAGIEIDNRATGRMPIKANEIIEEVFMNLMSNAVKYATSGGRVLIEGASVGDRWRVTVTDFGEGVKDEDKSAVFKRFFRKEKKGIKGSGFGLAIVKKITEFHGGRAWVEDNPHGGAVFVIELPKEGLERV